VTDRSHATIRHLQRKFATKGGEAWEAWNEVDSMNDDPKYFLVETVKPSEVQPPPKS